MRLTSILVLAAISGFMSSCVTSEELYQLSRYKKKIHELDASKTATDRWYALGDAAKESFNQKKYSEAKAFALELKAKTPQHKNNWNYGNAVQDFNLVLGRLALQDGDIKSAEKYLLFSGDSPGSPQMDSFGPNMSLAKDLIVRGHTTAVIAYFAKVRRFWAPDPEHNLLDRHHAQKLDYWAKEVQAGKVPDFGANLDY